MNCKPGDLAVVVRSDAGNEGRIGRCLRRATKRQIEKSAMFGFVNEPCWLMDREFSACDSFGRSGYVITILPDAILRPIRDPGDDAKDETLNWLPVPTKEALWLLLLFVGLFCGWFGLFTWPTLTAGAVFSGIALFLDSIFGENA